MTAPVLVIGASGEVGEGIVTAFLNAGRHVIATARSSNSLDALRDRLSAPERLSYLVGAIGSDEDTEALADNAGDISDVIVAVNGQRRPSLLADIDTDTMTSLIKGDLLSHYAAVRCFLPRLPEDGCFIGIGGGSADFILDGGVYMSMAQAALRVMYRGYAHERQHDSPALRELIVASVVAGRPHEPGDIDPLWVTPLEIGQQVVNMVERTQDYPGAIWRISRRDESGRPVITSESNSNARVLPL